MRPFLVPFAVLCLAACSETPTRRPAQRGSNTRPPDAGASADAAPPEADSGGFPDAGSGDSGFTDSGSTDSGFADSGQVDPLCPQASAFMDVASSPGAGARYPAPSLSVACTNDSVTVRGNGIPHYPFVRITPNDLMAQNHIFTFPKNPALSGELRTIPTLGTVAVAIDGLPIFGPNEADRPDPFGDPVLNAIMDTCMGHTAMRGIYHFHALLERCFLGEPAPGTPSGILGYALDGFPIYGQWACRDAGCGEVVKLKSGWEATGYEKIGCTTHADCSTGFRCGKGIVAGRVEDICGSQTYAWDHNQYLEHPDDPTFLDRCNGRVGPDGQYRYHVTETFPYVLGCYRGRPLR